MSMQPSPEGKVTIHGAPTCPKHSSKKVNYVCLTCKSLGCDTCISNHSGHEIKPCQNDGKLVQIICRSQTQQFYDILGELESSKDGTAEDADMLKDTKAKVHQNIQKVIQEANYLEKQINAKLDEAYKSKKKTESEIDSKIEKVDKRIGYLNSNRNVKDPGVLIPDAITNAALIDEFAYIGKHETTACVMLPNIHKLDDVIKEMKDVFDVDLKIATAGYDCGSVSEIEHVDIPNSKSTLYGLCDIIQDNDNCNDEIDVYEVFQKDVKTYHLKSRVFSTKHYGKTIYRCLRLGRDRYAAIDRNDGLHLMNGSNITHSQSGSYQEQALCYHSPNKIIKLNISSSEGPCTVTFSLLDVSLGKFVAEKEVEFYTEDAPLFAAVHPDKKTISMTSLTRLYKVNMATSMVNTHDTSGYYTSACSIYVDGNDNIFVGDNKGNIHMYDQNMAHRVVAKATGKVFGITIMNDELIATANAKIWRFRLNKK